MSNLQQAGRNVSRNNNMFDRKYNSGDRNVIGPNTQIDGNPILGGNSGNTNHTGDKINSGNNNTVNSQNTGRAGSGNKVSVG